MAAHGYEINPNNTPLSDYTIYVGNTVDECEEYVWREMDSFRDRFGDPTGTAHYATERFLSNQQKTELIHDFMQRQNWYQHK